MRPVEPNKYRMYWCTVREISQVQSAAATAAGLDDDLACSATTTVSEIIQKAFSKNFRANKDAKGSEKEAMARQAFGAPPHHCVILRCAFAVGKARTAENSSWRARRSGMLFG